jgi:multidrug resistance protein, MATE family
MSLSSDALQESRALMRLAAPIILSQIAQVMMGLVDTVMSGQAGAREQAVVGLGVALWVPVFMCLMSVVQALSPVVAHHYGAGDKAAVVRDTQEGLWLAAWVSVLPLGLMPWAADLLAVAGIDRALAERTELFLWGILLGMPAALVYRALAFYSASIHQTRPIMVLAFLGLAVNAALNQVLIHGHFGLPAMGGAGCGWATGIGMWVALIALVVWTRRAAAYRDYQVWRGWRRPRWAAQRQLLRIGVPMGGAALAEVTAFSSIAVLVGRFGDVQIAAHQVALNFSAMVFMLPMGLSAALSIRVGNALGAGDPVRARHVAWTGVALGLVIAACAILPIILLRHHVAAFYSSDAAVRAVAANLLLFAAFWQLFDATQVTAMGALRGYKVTLMPMVMMAFAFWGVGVPTGTWLGYRGWEGRPMEVYGFWVGLVVGLVLVSLGLVAALRRVASRASAGAATASELRASAA